MILLTRFIFLFIVLLALSSTLKENILPLEICDNAIDDDLDGLIDLNDDDCFCPPLETESLIPNPSFEEQDCCPEGHSSVYCATNWIQASEATSDYYHGCDWDGQLIFDLPQPIPDGEGFIGFFDGVYSDAPNPNWKEYVGTCLPVPLIPDTLYKFQFYMGFLDRISSPSTNIALFGATDCAKLPFGKDNGAFGCPANGPGWFRLGAVDVFGKNEWRQFEFLFTTQLEITALVVGPDCGQVIANNSPYYFLDQLVLAPSNNFNVEITASDHPCSPNLALEIFEHTGFNYQWYKDGVAIPGATTAILKNPPGEGEYQVKLENDNGCKLSKPYRHFVPFELSLSKHSICDGESFLFGNRQIKAAGIYWDTLKAVSGCDSLIRLDLQLIESASRQISAKILPEETFSIGGHDFNTPGRYVQTVPSEVGCDSIIYLNLEYYSLYVPNAFSPNGDGINDLFKVYSESDVQAISTLKVFDRWGNVMFLGNSLSPNDGWTGEAGGVEAPAGTYIYLARLKMSDGKERTIEGSLLLIR